MLRGARALAAFELADAVTPQHVERVADAVLMHRRRERGASSASSARDSETESSRESQRGSTAHSPSSSSSPSPDEAARGEGDWGYLPPQPAATTHVKGVIPLNVKKR